MLADARGSETSRSEGASSETEPATSDAIETTDPRESTSDPDRPSTATDSTDEPEGERVAQSSASTSTSTKVASPDEASPAPSSSNDASGEASDATQTPPAASTPETTLPPRGQALYSELRELRKRIPIVVIDLGRPVAEVERDVLSAIEKGEAFLRDFGDSTQGAWVRATLGRDYLLRVRRFEEEVRNRVKADTESLPRQEAEEEIERAVKEELAVYTARMRKLASDAYSKAPAGSEARYLALLLLTDLSERDFDCESSLRYARQVLAEYPDAAERGNAILDAGRALLCLERYEEVARWAEEMSARYKGDKQWVDYVELLLDSYMATANLQGILSLMDTVRSEFPARADATDSAHYSLQYRTEWATSGFWSGFARYALGDIEGARKDFVENRTVIDAWEAKLEAEGKKLPPKAQIWRDFRTIDYIYFLTEHHGKDRHIGETCQGRVETTDLTTAIRWVTPRSITFPEARGKVFALLFRKTTPRDARSAAFLQELDAIVKENPDVLGAMISFLPGRIGPADADERVEVLRSELAQLEVDLPAG
ncbi:MAG TPA: hypothetical protein VK116_02245, partial [Planctomycetota bacterium]|nr:hypothetical protein [Planctomycetota bacterium]